MAPQCPNHDCTYVIGWLMNLNVVAAQPIQNKLVCYMYVSYMQHM